MGTWEAGCPGLREVPDVRASGPDVRAGVAGLGALWIGGVRMSGLGGRMSGGSGRAGCPGLWPDVRADGVQLWVRFVMGAGFPGSGQMSGSCSSWLFFLLLPSALLGLLGCT